MRIVCCGLWVSIGTAAVAQARGELSLSAVSSAEANVLSMNTPGQSLIRLEGRALDATGQPITGASGVTFAIYAEQSGGAPLWQETQSLATDSDGRFSALLGAASASGVPAELFADGKSRWLGVLAHAPGVVEQPRILMVSVPYAIRARDAEMLGGRPASAYMTSAETRAENCPANSPAALVRNFNPALAAIGAAAGYVPVFTDVLGHMGRSLLVQSGNYIGLGTTLPSAVLNISGAAPVLRLDSYSSTAGSSANLNFYSARGTSAAHTGTQSGDYLGQIGASGYTGSVFPASKAKIAFLATEAWGASANGAAISFLTTANASTVVAERMRIDQSGRVGIGTTAPAKTLSFGGGSARSFGVDANPTAGAAGNDLSVSAGSAASGATNAKGGSLILMAGNGTGSAGGGDVQVQAAGDSASGAGADTMNTRLLIAGKPKAMTGAMPTANLFSLHLPAGEAAGGRVKFTIVASDKVHYAMETGEIAYLANPQQLVCSVVSSEISKVPPTYTNDVLSVPALGQSGALNAQCSATWFGSDPGLQIYDAAPTTFVPTSHKVYYTIENQSQAAITLQP